MQQNDYHPNISSGIATAMTRNITSPQPAPFFLLAPVCSGIEFRPRFVTEACRSFAGVSG
jgi:hypothetical protein